MLNCTFVRALVFLSILTAGAPAAGAAVLTLDACTPEALRALIAGAVDGDLLLLPACMIPVAGAPGDDVNASGDFDIATSITLQGIGPDATILDGGGLDRVLDIRPGATVVIADLTVRNGAAPGAEAGGGIRNDEVLTLLNVLVTGNTAGGGGGGVGCTFVSETLTVRGSRITGNSAGVWAEESGATPAVTSSSRRRRSPGIARAASVAESLSSPARSRCETARSPTTRRPAAGAESTSVSAAPWSWSGAPCPETRLAHREAGYD